MGMSHAQVKSLDETVVLFVILNRNPRSVGGNGGENNITCFFSVQFKRKPCRKRSFIFLFLTDRSGN